MVQVRSIMTGVAKALWTLHDAKEPMAHGDLKPNNVVWVNGKWALIDFDAAAKCGETIEFQGVTSSPEAKRKLPKAHPSFDIFSLGVILYEITTGQQLFSHVFDNIADLSDLRRFCVWLCVSDEALQDVLKVSPDDMSKLSAGLSFEELRQDAKHLIRWCLQGDPMQRPSLEQVLQHRFIKGQGGTAPPEPEVIVSAFSTILRCLSVRMRLHFFVPHYQVEASGDVAALSLSLRNHGALVARQNAKNLTGEGMRQGVADSDVIIIFLTSGVLTRLWCLMEIHWALEFDKPIIIVAETEQRFFAFDWVRWTQDRLARAGCFWGQRQPPKPLLLPPLSVDSKVKEAAGTQRARWPNVFVIRSSTGAALVSDVLDTLRQRYRGLSAQTSDEKVVPAALEQAEAVVVLLTTGVLAEGSSSMLQLRYAVQNAKPLFTMYSVTDWQFGGDESDRAPRWVTGVVSALEAMKYRAKWENEYEFLSMCDELLLRMVSPLKQLTPLSDAEVAAREEQERRSRASEAVQAKPASSTQPNAPTSELLL
eukprot:g46865.t1